jgi:hypothetical protein
LNCAWDSDVPKTAAPASTLKNIGRVFMQQLKHWSCPFRILAEYACTHGALNQHLASCMETENVTGTLQNKKRRDAHTPPSFKTCT